MLGVFTHTPSAYAHINLIILLILTKQANKQTNTDNDNSHLCPYTTEYNSGKAQDKLSIHIAKLISIQSLCALEKPIVVCITSHKILINTRKLLIFCHIVEIVQLVSNRFEHFFRDFAFFIRPILLFGVAIFNPFASLWPRKLVVEKQWNNVVIVVSLFWWLTVWVRYVSVRSFSAKWMCLCVWMCSICYLFDANIAVCALAL